MKEWYVIEDSRNGTVFFGEDKIFGYIPRDVVNNELGIPHEDHMWFTRKQSLAMRAHPEWTTDNPEQRQHSSVVEREPLKFRVMGSIPIAVAEFRKKWILFWFDRTILLNSIKATLIIIGLYIGIASGLFDFISGFLP